MKVYVASSWRCDYQPVVVKFLRELGHDVYDFKNPREDDDGFHWTEIDPNWKNWTPDQFVAALNTPLAQGGFKSDMGALKWCDVCVLVLPCNRSAHLELGWACGNGKKTIVLLNEPFEPELMYKMIDHVVGTLDQLKVAMAMVGTALWAEKEEKPKRPSRLPDHES